MHMYLQEYKLDNNTLMLKKTESTGLVESSSTIIEHHSKREKYNEIIKTESMLSFLRLWSVAPGLLTPN